MFPAPRRPTGLFFSFEGIDGSGKSTQARMLADALQAAGEDVVSVREPGGTVLGEQIRSLLLDPSAVVESRSELLLFAAARAQLVATVIEPVLKQGAHVIADRYTDSTIAYQGAGRQLGGSVPLDMLNSIATGGTEPARTYLISVGLAEAARRRSARALDRMEETDETFRGRVAEAYRQLADQHPERIQNLDGMLPAAVLHRTIRLDALDLIDRTKRSA